jgi:hypothetical protein
VISFDFHHNGAYLLSYWKATPLFGIQKSEQTTKSWYQFPDLGTKDDYQFIWMQVLCQTWINFTVNNEFWQQLKTTAVMTISGKNVGLQHLKDIKPAVMTVGVGLMPRIYMVLEYLPSD